MKIPRHRITASALAFSAVAVLATASPVAAQQVAYVTATQPDPCADPAINPDCTRGVIAVVNTAANQPQGTIEVWQKANFIFQAVLVNPAANRLYAVLTSAGSPRVPTPSSIVIKVYDTTTLSLVTESNVSAGAASECAFSADGTRLFCARNVLASDVAVIDTAANTVVSTIPASFPPSLAMGRDGHRLYIAESDNRVTVRDSASFAVLATVPLPAFARTLEVTPDGAHLYAALSDGSVADIDTATSTLAGVVAGLATGTNRLLDITFARGKAYVSMAQGTGTGEGVAVIDVASRSIVGSVPIAGPLGIDTNFDGSRVFVSGTSAVSAIDTASDQVVATTPLAGGPGRITLSRAAPFAGILIDAPAQGASLEQPFTFGGWAADAFGELGAPGIDAVHVWAFPASGGSAVFVGAAEYGRPRPDIAALFGAEYLNAGYQTTVRGLPPGSYTIAAFGHSSRTGTFAVASQIAVTVLPSVRLAIDTPAPGAAVPPSFTLAGWALDGAALSGSGVDAVHVWAYPSTGAPPIFAGAATLGFERPDVAAAFGAQFGTAGYGLTISNLPAGSYTLVVYAHQASSRTFAAQAAVNVVVTAPQPAMFIDLPAQNAAVDTSVRVAGWAIEVGAAAGTGVDAVHVWAYPTSGAAPTFVGAAAYGAARPDIGSIFGSRYTPSGFDVTGTLTPGVYDIVAYAHSTTTNSFNGVRVVRVTVQ